MNPSILRNLTSEQWKLLSGLIPAPKTGGRKRSVDMQASSTQFYTSCVRVVRGECSQTIFLNGKLSITIFELGARMELGNKSMSVYGCGYVFPVTEKHLPLKPLWIVKQLKLRLGYPKKLATTLGKRLRDVNAIYLLIHACLLIVVVITAANVSEQAGAKQVLVKLNKVRDRNQAFSHYLG
jgi:putative transposase